MIKLKDLLEDKMPRGLSLGKLQVFSPGTGGGRRNPRRPMRRGGRVTHKLRRFEEGGTSHGNWDSKTKYGQKIDNKGRKI